MQETKAHLIRKFSIKDIGRVKYFLEIEVACLTHGIVLTQRKYNLDILKDARMENCRPSEFPIEQHCKLQEDESEPYVEPMRYRRMLGKRYLVKVGDSPISWRSKKQSVVARSSTEAEYRAIASTVSELIWLRWLMKELQAPQAKATPLYCDNQATLHIAMNPVFNKQTKHVEMDCYFVRERVQTGEIEP
ncbi:uncharacterized mitochondrial protein AtMg00810-like [Prosopis cineraria]|uniref:uncharacterized mitochondrial protein AtMg00810-like n=1 Tax=Prosopis cineraria TaxID=364024 RepID=UPI00240EC868|nr:uncharacterized mitochondrial protein AtMg00810-like [Prosopis cineraria]